MAFGIGDIFDIIGIIGEWKRDKSDSKAQELWNKYNRQVDIHALDAMIDRLDRKQSILYGRIGTEQDRRQRHLETADLLGARSRRLNAQADWEHRLTNEDMNAARNRAYHDAARLREQYGVEDANLASKRLQVGIEGARQVIDRRALQRDLGARGGELRGLVSQLNVERGALTETQAAKENYIEARMALLGLEPDGTTGVGGDKSAARIAALDAEQEDVEERFRIGRSRLIENAVRARTSTATNLSGRGMTGSFFGTESDRIARETKRSEDLLRTGQKRSLASIESRRFMEGIVMDEESGTYKDLQTEARRAGLIAERTSLRASGDVQRAQLLSRDYGAARAYSQLDTDRERGYAELGFRGRQSQSQRGVLQAEYRHLSGSRVRNEDELRERLLEVGRGRRRADLGYAAGKDQAASAWLARNQARTESRASLDNIGQLRSDMKDADISQEIAKWQKSILPDLPLQGSSRSALGLVMTIMGEIWD